MKTSPEPFWIMNAEGNIVGIEILDASKRMPNPRSIEHGVMS